MFYERYFLYKIYEPPTVYKIIGIPKPPTRAPTNEGVNLSEVKRVTIPPILPPNIIPRRPPQKVVSA